MKPVIINGSPRNKKSNSRILIGEFLKGYNTVDKDPLEIYYLADPKQRIAAVDAFRNNEQILVIFPLYTDCMPGIVKEYFELIAQLPKDEKKRVGYIVQSGFPESKHSVCLEKYLEKFTVKYLKCEYLGTVIKGGVEGIQIMPPGMNEKLFNYFFDLGVYYAEHQEWSEEIRQKLARPYSLSAARIILFKLFNLTGLSNYYWNSKLKKNNAFDKRYDRPFEHKVSDY